MEKILKQKKGITLIALVITIIVLLILAAISISMLSGDNSILNRATQAKNVTGEKQIQEKIRLAVAGAIANGNGSITEDLLKAELNKQFGENGYVLEDKGDYWEVKVGDVTENVTKSGSSTHVPPSGNSLTLSANVRETESRAAVIEVSVAAGTPPTEEELQAKSQDELKLMFVAACQQLNAPFTSWNDISHGNTTMTIEDAYNNFPFLASQGYTSAYDLIIKKEGYNVATFTLNGETITGARVEFVVTNPSTSKITATNSNGDYGEIVWDDEYPASKEEEYSTIQDSNYKLSKDGYEVWVPAGFAYGTSENVGTVTTGLVITDSVEEVNGKKYSNGNEFVWIPVDKDNLTVGKTNKKMAEISSGTNYRGVLYDWNSDSTGNTTFESTDVYKEPAYITYFDNNNTVGITEEVLQNEYNAMIKSVKKYGGFYVARYEMGDGALNISKLNVMPYKEIEWYEAYSKAKAYNKNGVTSGMIWGSQWDAMLNFGLTNSLDSAKVIAETNGNHNYTILKTGVWLGSNSQTDKINNIFDLEGNVREWTMGAIIDIDPIGEFQSITSGRIIRGLSSKYSSNLGASNHGRYSPFNSEDNYISDPFATRVALYIN